MEKKSKLNERVELSCLTCMSPDRAVGTIEEYIVKAHELGMDAIAITDFWNVQAFPDAARATDKLQDRMKIIYGMEAPFAESHSVHSMNGGIVSILSKDRTGLTNLYSMITKYRADPEMLNVRKEQCVIDEKTISEYRNGLLIGSGNWQDLISVLPEGHEQDTEKLSELAALFDYLEVRPNHGDSGREQYQETVKRMIRLGELTGKIVVATGNVSYLDPEDRICLDILCHTGINDVEYTKRRHLMTTEEMLNEFAFLGKEKAEEIVVTNSRRIASMIDDMKPIPEEKKFLMIDNADAILKEACTSRLNEIYPNGVPQDISVRCEKDLADIKRHGYASEYVMVMNLVAKGKEDGYAMSPRGCVASSFIAFLSGITDINPAEEDYCPMPGEQRPSFELNMSKMYWDTAIEYLRNTYGRGRVIRLGMTGRLTGEDIEARISRYCKDQGVELTPYEKERITQKLCNQKRKTNANPVGVFVLPEGSEITEYTPLQYNEEIHEPITHISYHYLDENFTKLNLISNRSMTMLHMLKESTGKELRYSEKYEKEILELFRGTNEPQQEYSCGTIDLPEFSSDRIRKMIREIKPDSIEDIIRIDALSHGTGAWEENAEKLLRGGTADFKEVIASRDDVYLYLISKGISVNKAYEIMEYVRKGWTRRRKNNPWGECKVLMRTKGVPEWYIDSCEKIEYLFPKAHCAAATYMSLDLALYKIYFPEEFGAVCAGVC